MRSRRATLNLSRRLLAAAVALCLLPDPSAAQAVQWCQRDTSPDASVAEPQNVILFLLDDMSAAALPYISRPVVWPDEDAPPVTGDATATRLRVEAGHRRPDLNRLAARMFANADGSLGTAAAGPDAGALVVPIDLQDGAGGTGTTAGDFSYSPDSTNPARHILHGHGGLRRLATEGVVFDRFYATSGKCAPTRATVMTGRHPTQVGVSNNGARLRQDQLAFAGFLKQLCEDEDDDTPCYTTGYVGKWHLGDGASRGMRASLWTRGFDEGIYYPGNTRFHWSTSPLSCAPQTPDVLPEDPSLPTVEGYFCTNPRVEKPDIPLADSSTYYCRDAQDCEWDLEDECSGGRCECSYHQDQKKQFCYEVQPLACNPDAHQPCAVNNFGSKKASCVRWPVYAGSTRERTRCHPKDGLNPDCCEMVGSSRSSTVRAHRYDFRRKLARDGTRLYSVDTASSSRCEDSGLSAFESGCQYDTRFYRDVAKSFIVRHGRQSNTPGSPDYKRFALYVAPHATHVRRSAPASTEAHYKTLAGVKAASPGVPEDPVSFYAVIEEIDAAVGQIMDVVRGFCDANSGTFVDARHGRACQSNADCTEGVSICNQSLANNTVVLFTADQGHTVSAYGQPLLRGGKGNVYEGGIRVGLAAWGPGIGIGEEGNVADTAIGSQVDLFATIAHAAGCEPSASDGVRYTVNVCADKSRSACDPAGAPCPYGGACVSRTLEGRTLLPAMSPAVADAMDRSHARDFAFAHYPEAGRTMTMRQGYLAERCAALAAECPDPQNCVLPAECGAAKVCGYSAHKEASVGGPEEPHIARERTGGTCQTCSEASDCTESSSPPCRLNGKFCVPNEKVLACGGDAPASCEPLEYARCRDPRSECRSDAKCMAVVTRCSGCYDAAWKIRGETSVAELFDLATNPEEADKDAGLGALNCRLGAADEDGIWALQQRMKASLDSWASCVTGSGSGHCEAAEEAWP